MTAEELEAQAEENAEALAEEEEAEVIDPDDPLYGLDFRLAESGLDEESLRIIKLKLHEAHSKIRTGLDQRQANLDAKLVNPKKK